jgi:hypothetical protein
MGPRQPSDLPAKVVRWVGGFLVGSPVRRPSMGHRVAPLWLLGFENVGGSSVPVQGASAKGNASDSRLKQYPWKRKWAEKTSSGTRFVSVCEMEGKGSGQMGEKAAVIFVVRS